jgi:hypothetical protein
VALEQERADQLDLLAGSGIMLARTAMATSDRSVPQGESDVITLTTEYYADLDAPNKELALIKDAGHFAAFTRPDRFLTELLTRARRLVTKAQSSPECEP